MTLALRTRPLAALKWFGTATGVSGAAMLAQNIPISGWGWVLFAASALAWTVAGAVQRDASLVVLQGAFLALNLVGVWRWLIV